MTVNGRVLRGQNKSLDVKKEELSIPYLVHMYANSLSASAIIFLMATPVSDGPQKEINYYCFIGFS